MLGKVVEQGMLKEGAEVVGEVEEVTLSYFQEEVVEILVMEQKMAAILVLLSQLVETEEQYLVLWA